MFGLQGSQESFGNLVGFPRTGTRMVWLADGDGEAQRGYYGGRERDPAARGTPWTHAGAGYARYTGPQLARMGARPRTRAFSSSWWWYAS